MLDVTEKAKNGSLVVCTLPKAGLGNQLFPLMKAAVCAHLNRLPLMVIGYNAIRVGPYLRREKSKRNYSNYFVFEKGRVGELLDKWRLSRIKRTHKIVQEPRLDAVGGSGADIYLFSLKIDWKDFFHGLRDHRDVVRKLLWYLLNDSIKKKLNELPSPTIGVHIRLGDFRKLQEHEKFSSAGGARTPEQYFIEVIESIRKANGTVLPVQIFTDGYKHELPELFKLPDVSLVQGNSDIVDMLLLSRSQIIVTSAGSTFSYWAGFLSDAPIIMHPDHIHSPIRSHDHHIYYEGPLDLENEILRKCILSVRPGSLK